MANPNPTIWGDSTSWVNAPNAYGLTSSIATTLNAQMPKCENFGGTVGRYNMSLYRALDNHRFTINEYIDNSICPCGQSPDVSPFAKIAIFNENNDLSTTPRIYEITNSNINWFFADCVKSINNAYNYHDQYTYDGSHRALSLEQYAPKANTNTGLDNTCFALAPYTYYGLRSFVLSIEVNLLSPDDDNPTRGTWRSLDAWKNDYPTYNCIGMRLFARNCTQIGSSTLALTYNNAHDNPPTGYSTYLAITNTIPIINNGVETNTQLLSIFAGGVNSRSAYIFNVTPQIFNYNDYRRQRAVLPAWNYFDGQTVQAWYSALSDPVRYFFYKIPYNQANYDKMMSIAALFGCYFTPTNKYQFAYDMLDNDLYLPVLDGNGVAHGQYTRGADNANNSLYSKNSIRDIDYNPETPPKPVDTNTYSVTTGFNTVGNVASTTKAYVINGDGIKGLSNELWTIIDNLLVNPTDIENLYNMSLDTFLTNNPIDAIVSVKKFPLLSVPHGESLENVYLGKMRAGAAAYPLAMQQARYNFTSIPIFPKFGNCFLDYSPYTKMQLYVPFCGTIDIDAADFMGRNLSVEMVIDFITGTVTAYVLANELVVTSLTGTCAIDIPITGTEQVTVNSAYESAAITERQARGNWIMERVGLVAHPIKTLTKPLTSVAKDVSTQLTQAQSAYELTHINMPLRQIGNASPLNSWAIEFVCRLIIYYPDGECISFNATNEPSLITEKVESFGAVNGFATVETNTLSSFTGFTQVSDADLSGISATDTEKEMILSLLQSGVYL